MVVGGPEPAEPALDDAQPWTLLSYGLHLSSLDGWPGAGPYTVQTVWFGGVDALGNFTGWDSIVVELPSAQERRVDRVAGANSDSTDTAASREPCTGGALVLGPIAFTDGPPATPASSGCATTGPPGGVGWLALVVLSLVRLQWPLVSLVHGRVQVEA